MTWCNLFSPNRIREVKVNSQGWVCWHTGVRPFVLSGGSIPGGGSRARSRLLGDPQKTQESPGLQSIYLYIPLHIYIGIYIKILYVFMYIQGGLATSIGIRTKKEKLHKEKKKIKGHNFRQQNSKEKERYIFFFYSPSF